MFRNGSKRTKKTLFVSSLNCNRGERLYFVIHSLVQTYYNIRQRVYNRQMFILRFNSSFQKITLCGLLTVLLFSNCGKQELITFSSIKDLSPQEAILRIELEKDPVNWPRLCSNYFSTARSNGKSDSFIKPTVDYLYKRSIKEKNTLGYDAYYRIISYQFLTKGELDSAIHYGYKVLALKSQHDSIDPSHGYHILGLSYFYKEQNSDSTRYYWTKGYKEAEIKKDNHMIILFGINLGTFYHNNGNTRNARSLFLRAHEIGLKTKVSNSILTNNIVNTFIDEGQLEEADKFWKANEKQLTADLNSYKGQLFLLNRIKLLQFLDKWEEAQIKFKLLNVDSIKPTLFQNYAQIFIDNKLMQKDFDFANDPFWRKTMIDYAPHISFNTSSSIIENITSPKLDFFIKHLISLESDTIRFNKLSLKFRAKICKQLGYYFKVSNPVKANTYFAKSIDFLNDSKTEENKTQQKVIDELHQLEDTFTEIKVKEDIIEDSKKTQKILFLALALITIISILGVLLVRNIFKIKNIERKQLQTEQDALKSEQELNNRIVEYSKSLIERNTSLRNEISQAIAEAPNAIKARVSQILKEFHIGSFNAEENPTIAKQLLKEKEDWNDKYPGFDDLNKTEQRVFVLIMESYRPKEIANVLGVSTQYVRNVKSRLKTKLNLTEDWGN